MSMSAGNIGATDINPEEPIIAIVGATATGKSALADMLAANLDAEIISADSMQVYRGMDIGTAKVPLTERSVAYHGIDLVDPGQNYTAALYQRMARAQIKSIAARGHRVVFCGGSGLYLRAALDDFDLDAGFDGSAAENAAAEAPASAITAAAEAPASAASLRAQLQEQAAELGPEAFHARLAEDDPDSAALIHPHNVRRVIRAFEWLAQGQTYAQQAGGFARFASTYPLTIVGLALERDLLYDLINLRVEAMLAAGLLEEVESLAARGFAQALTAMQAIGYKELLAYLDGRQGLLAATEQIKQATRRLAKRQVTWFRRDPRLRWLDISDLARQEMAGSLTPTDVRFQIFKRCQDLLAQGPA